MLNGNVVPLGFANRKLVAMNPRQGEVRKGRERTPFGYNLTICHNSEVPRKRIPVDLDS